MRHRLILLRTELKRAAAQLPSMLWKAAILIFVISVTVFCALYFVQGRNNNEPAANVGYCAPPDDELIQFAISYIENMESMQGWCNLVPMDTDKGLDALYNGDIAAFIEFPKGMVEDIISGENRPATLYVSDTKINEGILGEVFEELADAGISILQMAQAQIYATADICMEHNNAEFNTASQLNELYSDIDSYNIKLVLNREQLFKNYKLSLTGNEGMTVYYASAFLVLYVLLIGMLFSKYCKCDRTRQHILKERLGHSYKGQFATRNFVLTGLIIVMLALTVALNCVVDVVISFKTVILMVAALCLVAAYYEFIYQLAQNTHTEVVIIGISAIIQGYLSGCFIPTALLPQIIVKIGKYIPSGFLKTAFTILFTGEMTQYVNALAGICLWAAFFMIVTVLAMKSEWKPGNRYKLKTKSSVVKIGGRIKTSCSFILFKRLIHQKILWLFLIIMTIVSALIDNLEQRSDTEITVAVYDESAGFEQNLSENDKLVSFIFCDSSKEVRDMVLKGKAQCGYILPKDLIQCMKYGEAERLVKVYELGDAMLTPMINEIVFAQIYKEVSRDMYEDFIDEKGLLEEIHRKTDLYLDTRLTDNSTFHIDKKVIQSKNHDNKNDLDALPSKKEVSAALLKEILAAAVIILCAAAGIIQALMDYKAHYFYRHSPAKIILIIVIQYLFIGVAAALMVL